MSDDGREGEFHGPREREISQEDCDFYREVFEEYDDENNGTIPREMLATAIRDARHNPTEEELDDMLNDVDENHGGVIEFDLFLHFCKCLRSPDEDSECLEEAFKMFDEDESGYLERDELWNVLRSTGEGITDEDLECLLNEADTNGDGQIDYKEFVKYMSPKNHRQAQEEGQEDAY